MSFTDNLKGIDQIVSEHCTNLERFLPVTVLATDIVRDAGILGFLRHNDTGRYHLVGLHGLSWLDYEPLDLPDVTDEVLKSYYNEVMKKSMEFEEGCLWAIRLIRSYSKTPTTIPGDSVVLPNIYQEMSKVWFPG